MIIDCLFQLLQNTIWWQLNKSCSCCNSIIVDSWKKYTRTFRIQTAAWEVKPNVFVVGITTVTREHSSPDWKSWIIRQSSNSCIVQIWIQNISYVTCASKCLSADSVEVHVICKCTVCNIEITSRTPCLLHCKYIDK